EEIQSLGATHSGYVFQFTSHCAALVFSVHICRQPTMRMLLRSEFPNGPFGDPALYVWEIHENDAMLLDCGDLSRFSVRQLLKARYVFVSHCHMDHFFGFDFFLRVHMGRAKRVTFFGPPRTSD